MRYSNESVKLLQEVGNQFLQHGVLGRLQPRFELIDKYIQRTIDSSIDMIEARTAARAGKRDRLQNQEVPIVLQQLDTAHARLVGTFLTGYPLLSFVATPEKQNIASMYSALVERDQERFGWVPHLSRALRDALRYNAYAVEVDWDTVTANEFRINGKERETSAVTYAGNRIQHIDMYNFLFDPTVPLHQLSAEGAYAGYVFRRNYIGTKMYLQRLQERKRDFCILRNFNTALDNTAQAGGSRYYVPDIVPLEDRRLDSDNWEGFFGFSSANSERHTNGKYEITVLYARLIPSQYGLTMQRSGTPAPFKLVWVGSTLVYAEPLRNAHGLLPIIAAHGYDDALGWQSNSFAENLMDMQDSASAMMNGTINSMRRAVSDRALYNPLLVNPKDVNSANPAAKIAVRSNAYNNSLDAAYKPIPYEDRLSPALQANMQTVLAMANQITGLNPAAQGSFVKGNRTQGEFGEVMSNSDARMQRFALDCENLFFAPLKRIVKLNYMQYAAQERVLLRSSQQLVNIDPVELLQQEADFKVADGVFPVSKAMSSDVMTAAFNTIAQMPELDREFNRALMFTHLVKAQGVDLDNYKRSPEEIAQYDERMRLAQEAAAKEQAK